MAWQGRVLCIDNRESIRDDCRRTLETAGFSITFAETGEQGLEKVRQESFDVALLSLEIPGSPAMEVLNHLKQESPNTSVILLAREPDAGAVENGAFDSLPEPFAPGALAELVGRAVRHSRRALEDSCIGQELERMMLSQVLIGRSEPMNRVGRFVQKAASVDSAVLITGEPGTGKEVVARAIHRLSRRSRRRFVAVDCRQSAESLLERILFGQNPGAIPDAAGDTTGKIELADGGTLFLKEIAGIGGPVQEKLLRVILEKKIPADGKCADKTVDVRVITATRKDMSRQMDEGLFREDLFYRLNTIHIDVPPLRERLEDIPLLADYYIRKSSAGNQRPAQTISAEAVRSLKRREWPGNVRELIQVLELAVAKCKDKTIELRDLPPEATGPLDSNGDPGGYLARLEKSEIQRILEQFQGNKTQAARYLGINRKTLREKMERYGITQD
jgi:DNA-binding NtrC family response regulator